ncbi:MAG TPA: hypothetical protein VES67_02050 [Vicinamibacterales bacterium]|nr:hypothetical protein [Vicinamibacterales bacterium]
MRGRAWSGFAGANWTQFEASCHRSLRRQTTSPGVRQPPHVPAAPFDELRRRARAGGLKRERGQHATTNTRSIRRPFEKLRRDSFEIALERPDIGDGCEPRRHFCIVARAVLAEPFLDPRSLSARRRDRTRPPSAGSLVRLSPPRCFDRV